MLWGNYIFGLSKYHFTFMPSGNLHNNMSQLGFTCVKKFCRLIRCCLRRALKYFHLKSVPTLGHTRFFHMYKCNNFGMNFTSHFLHGLHPFASTWFWEPFSAIWKLIPISEINLVYTCFLLWLTVKNSKFSVTRTFAHEGG